MRTCSSAYMLAAKVALEYAYYFKFQKRIYLQQYEFLQCDYNNNQCLGGYPERSLDYAFYNGMASNYYTGTDTCQRTETQAQFENIKGNFSYTKKPFSISNVKDSLDNKRGVILPVSLKTATMKTKELVEDKVVAESGSQCSTYAVDSYVVALDADLSEGYVQVYYFQGRSWGFSSTMRVKPCSATTFMSQAAYYIEVSFNK